MATHLINVSNLAAHGVEWVSETGTRYQLSLPRGTTCLVFGAQFADGGQWSNMVVTAPERLGLKGPCKTFKEFEPIARLYVDGATEDIVTGRK